MALKQSVQDQTISQIQLNQASQHPCVPDTVTHLKGNKTSKVCGVQAAPDSNTGTPENLHLILNMPWLVISLKREKTQYCNVLWRSDLSYKNRHIRSKGRGWGGGKKKNCYSHSNTEEDRDYRAVSGEIPGSSQSSML